MVYLVGACWLAQEIIPFVYHGLGHSSASFVGESPLREERKSTFILESYVPSSKLRGKEYPLLFVELHPEPGVCAICWKIASTIEIGEREADILELVVPAEFLDEVTLSSAQENTKYSWISSSDDAGFVPKKGVAEQADQ